MSCCGKQRTMSPRPARISPSHPSRPSRAPVHDSSEEPRRIHGVFFEYVGRTSLTVIGPKSGKRYRFDNPGAKVEVDLRDRPWLAAMVRLRETK